MFGLAVGSMLVWGFEAPSISWGLVAAALMAANFRHHFRSGDEELRRRLRWVVAAGVSWSLLLAAAMGPEVAVHVGGSNHPLVQWLHAALLPSSLIVALILLTMAVTYSGALDPRLVVRRSWIYGLAGLILTTVFVGLEEVLADLGARWLHLPRNAGGWVAGVAAALAFGPLKAKLDRVISPDGADS